MNYGIFRSQPIMTINDLAQIGSHNKREKKAYKSNKDIKLELTKNNICTNDVKRDNSILGKNGIVIIDPDLFYLVESSDAFLRQINKKNLFKLYNSIIINSLEDDIYYQKNANIIRALLESIKITEKTDVTHEISKTLKYVNKPKELFK